MDRAPILVADVGGTNTRLALADAGRLRAGTVQRRANAEAPSLAALLAAYLRELAAPAPAGVCVALAGPVRDGAGAMTNLGWRVSEAALSQALGGVPARLLNDLAAQGHALERLAPADLCPLIAAAPRPGAPRLVIGLGTGFNAAVVHAGPGGPLVAAAEAGHATLPAADDEIAALAAAIARDGTFPEIEAALSGAGLARIDAWLADAPPRPAPQITAALAAGEPRAIAAVRLFTRILGAVAGDLALIHLPFGGIYLIGGMARAVGPQLRPFGLAGAFAAKGRFSGLMQEFPVWLVKDDYAALTGCAALMARGGAG